MLLSLSKVQGIALVPSFDDGGKLMLAAMQHSLEGVVSKRKASTYTSGRGPPLGEVQDADVAAGKQGSMGTDGSEVGGVAE
jgi:hypothetical protein